MTMKSKRTKSEVDRWMRNRFSEEWSWSKVFEGLPDFLGVELAPEPEPLPDFWNKRLHTGKHEEGGSLFLYKPSGTGVLIDPHTAGLETAARNRAALALSHSLRVAAAELVREETHSDGGLMWRADKIRRLRKILLDNELPEAGGER